MQADPADINVLPEYEHDVRVVANLFDGVLRTCDDTHLWLAPYTAGRRNLIFVDLGYPRALSMLRVWNYNKSRIHSFRGARLLEVKLDGHPIFRGEVNKAPGALAEAEGAAEPILFTLEPRVLERIEEHDRRLFEYEPVSELPDTSRERPSTAERQMAANASSLRPSESEVPEAVRSALARPRTAAVGAGGAGVSAGAQVVHSLASLQDYSVVVHPAGRQLKLVLHGTWGDGHYLGMNGLEILSPTGATIPLHASQLRADPPSIASLNPQLANDPRTLDKLVDGVNATYDDRHMFLAPFTPGRSNHICVDLRGGEVIGAIRVWNYSKTVTRGVRSFEILLDGALLYQGSMRPAPVRSGPSVNADSDFVQTVLFTDNPSLLAAEAANVYNKEDLEDGLMIYDNGQKLGANAAPTAEELVRPETAAVGAAPPTARGGARPPLRSMANPRGAPARRT